MAGRIRRKPRDKRERPMVRSVIFWTLLGILSWRNKGKNNVKANGIIRWSLLSSATPFGLAMVDGYLVPSLTTHRHRHGQWGSRRRSFHSITRRTTTKTTRTREPWGRRERFTIHDNHRTRIAVLSGGSNAEITDDAIDDRPVIEVLRSYVKNIQRARNSKGGNKAASSLAHFLQNNVVDSKHTQIHTTSIEVRFDGFDEKVPPIDDDSNNDDTATTGYICSVREVLERALVPALRQAGESNDYRLVLRLVSGSIAFANDQPVLTTRIFGEALNALSQTTANATKLKSVWNSMFGNHKDKPFTEASKLPLFLASPPTAFELNTYLKSMAALGKSRACIDTYHQYCTPHRQKSSAAIVSIQPDAYTLSILLSVLADSVSPSQKMCDPVDFASGMKYRDTTPEAAAVARNTPKSLRTKIESLTFSTCWQWNAAVELLRTLPEDEPANNSRGRNIQWRNNYVYSSLLKLQDKAQDLCSGQNNSARRHKNGPELTMAILDDMIQHDVFPDAVTCTLAIKAMGRATATTSTVPSTESITVAYDEKENRSSNLAVRFLDQMKSNPKLPHPNQYSYSAAIKACAREKDHKTALNLLEEMRRDYCTETAVNDADTTSRDNDTRDIQITPPPNTWVYNTALLSLDNKENSNSQPIMGKWTNKQMKKKWDQKNTEMNQNKRTEVALSLLNQMKNDHEYHGLDTKPDTITYNTVLGIGTFPYKSSLNLTEPTTTSALSIIDQMKKDGIARDSITYRNAIDFTLQANEIMEILNECLRDSAMRNRKSKGADENPMTEVFNVGLHSLTARGDFEAFKHALMLMFENNVEMTSETFTALIYAVGKKGNGKSLENLIQLKEEIDDEVLDAESPTHNDLLVSVGLFENIGVVNKMPTMVDSHYTEAIKICLRENEFGNAYTILSMMRAKGFNPTTSCMEGFALAYAQSAMDTIAREKKQKKLSEEKQLSACLSCASSAYKIVTALARPRSSTLGRVARACAATGQWTLCRTLLRSIHKNLLTPEEDGSTVTISPRVIQTIRGTHSHILRECAKQGNVHAALHYTSDIQELNKKVRARNQVDNQEAAPVPKFAAIPSDEDDIFRNLRGATDSLSSKTDVGMQPNDWISLIQAASKSGQWKVCFNTLQYLRPYVERTNLDRHGTNHQNSSSGNEKYNQLSQALYTVTRSLESHSQYAWAYRVIEDWIEWSGRQPRVESVLSAIRALASKGCIEEIGKLMSACLRDDLARCSIQNARDDNNGGMTYEKMLYVGTVTALHNNGLYDDADEMFMAGIQDGYLPFDFVREQDQFVVDLHGLNVALAHSVVRIAMRQQAATLADEEKSASGGGSGGNMMIITGKGRHSGLYLRPVLRPEVQRMLLEEFYPPLNTMSVPGNIGALTILAQDIEAWQEHQQQQKGVRMLKLAGLLRNLSSQERLKQIIALRLEASNTNTTDTDSD